jgi:phenylpropionate dioxygenase-like ring-hydroxylating dioxygenase large terminal subunit
MNWPYPQWATTRRWPTKVKAALWCAHADGVQLVSNVCRHRQAIMLKGRGQTQQQVVCPLAPLDL